MFLTDVMATIGMSQRIHVSIVEDSLLAILEKTVEILITLHRVHSLTSLVRERLCFMIFVGERGEFSDGEFVVSVA